MENLLSNNSKFNRVTLIVLDGAGIGEMPDAEAWGDKGSDTFGHILESRAGSSAKPAALRSWQHSTVERRAGVGGTAGLLRTLRLAFKRQRHNHGSLGNGRDNSGEGISQLIQTDFLLTSSISLFGKLAYLEFSETFRPQALKSSRSLATNMSGPPSPSFTPPAIRFFRLPHTKK